MWLEKKKSTVKIKTKIMSWISLQAHNVQKAKEATDPQSHISTEPHTRDPQTFMDRILESTNFKINCKRS